MAYFRVVAGLFGYLFLVTAGHFLFETSYSTAVVSALMAAGMWWFALAKPFQEYLARRAARDAALIARAEAGHAAFLVNDPAAFSPPPPVEAEPQMTKGLKIAIATAVGFAVLFTGSVVFGVSEEDSQSAVAVVRLT